MTSGQPDTVGGAGVLAKEKTGVYIGLHAPASVSLKNGAISEAGGMASGDSAVMWVQQHAGSLRLLSYILGLSTIKFNETSF